MSTRAEIPFTVEKTVSSNSQPVSGASIQVNIRGGGAATVYSTETGGTTLSNPLTSDSNGRIEGWVDTGSYDLVVSGSGITTYTQSWEATRADLIDTAHLVDSAVTTAKLTNNAVTTAKLVDANVTAAKLVQAVIDQLVLPGTVVAYAGTSAPSSAWLLCDGSSQLRASYPNLFAVTGSIYGSVDGTHFNVPDLRGRAPFGVSGASGRVGSNNALGGTAGHDTVTLTTSTMPTHSHGVSDPGHGHVVNDPGHSHGSNTGGQFVTYDGTTSAAQLALQSAFQNYFRFNGGTANNTTGVGLTGNTTGISITNTGSGGAHENMPPYLILNWLIHV